MVIQTNDPDDTDLGPLPDPQIPLVPPNTDLEPEDYAEGTEGEDDSDDADFEPVLADESGPVVPDQPIAVGEPHESFTAGVVSSRAVTLLRNLGWRIRSTGEAKQAVEHFQAAWNLGAALTVDGIPGNHTMAALEISEARRRKGLPTASAHFSFTEFSCKCGGRYTNCARIWIKRNQIRDLEAYRADLGHGLAIVSGCRCPGHNHDVGGVPHSRHMLGDASDFADERHPDWFRSRHLFNGLGYNHSNGLVRHGDQGGVRTWIYV